MLEPKRFKSKFYTFTYTETRRLREKCRIKTTSVLALQQQRARNTFSSNENQAISPATIKTTSEELDKDTKNAPKRHQAMSPKDFKMARVLLSIVLIFFICHLPR